MEKGLLVFVLRAKTDGTGDGITKYMDELILAGEGCELFEGCSGNSNVVTLVRRNLRNDKGEMREYIHAIPFGEPGGMFGGNFIYTSDSRFPNDYPIPVHDRFER